jgi:hypothetical protein
VNHRLIAHRGLFAVLAATVAVLLTGALATPASARTHVDEIALPNGFSPEDIAAGAGSSFYVGSLTDGAIFEGDFHEGTGHVVVPSSTGPTTGLFVQRQGGHDDLLWSAGGPSGQARLYDADSGKLLRTFQVADPSSGAFVSDVIVTKDAAYYSDSFVPQMYVIPLHRKHGRTVIPSAGAARTVPLHGDVVYQAGQFNLNGIAFVNDTLVMAQTVTGELFAVNPKTGNTKQIPLTDKDGDPAAIVGADGIAQRGNTLIAAENIPNRIATVQLNRHASRARLLDVISDPKLDVPSSVEENSGDFWALNARFTTPPGPNTTYNIVRVKP